MHLRVFLLAIAATLALVHGQGLPRHATHYTAHIPVHRGDPSNFSSRKSDSAPTIPLPAVRYKVFVHSELVRTPRSLHAPEDLHCHYTTEAPWRTDGIAPLQFYYNAAQSGLNETDVAPALERAFALWREEEPLLPPLQLTKNEDGTVPSTFSNQTRNGRNEIAFVEPRTSHPHAEVLSEVFVWTNHTSKEILEVDIIFHCKTEDIEWRADERVGKYHFDLLSVAVANFGHAIGVGISNNHYHSSFALTKKGETHKRTLECGDKRAVRELYGKRANS
jgi:hypothetical protein